MHFEDSWTPPRASSSHHHRRHSYSPASPARSSRRPAPSRSYDHDYYYPPPPTHHYSSATYAPYAPPRSAPRKPTRYDDIPSSDGVPESWVFENARNPSIAEFFTHLSVEDANTRHNLPDLAQLFEDQHLFDIKSLRRMSAKELQDAVPGIVFGTAQFILDKIARYLQTTASS